MPQSERTAQLLDTVDELLRSTQEPVHYRDLCRILLETGLWVGWGKEPDQCLYSALHNDVIRSGPQGSGRFLFLGRGVFCTSFVEGAEFLAEALETPSHGAKPRDPYARPGDMPGEAERRRAEAEAADSNRRCGNCTHLSWDGPNIHTHEAGSCSMYTQTRRAVVFSCSEACELWRRRTPAQSNSDRYERSKAILDGMEALTRRRD